MFTPYSNNNKILQQESEQSFENVLEESETVIQIKRLQYTEL